MINEKGAKMYCCEDIFLIENYEAAVNDTTQVWDCHHRAEILPCGTFSRNDLKKYNLLYKQPAGRLIFLTHAEHSRLHRINRSENERRKRSESASAAHKGKPAWNKGKRLSEEHKRKLGESHKGKNNCHLSIETKKKLSEATRVAMNGMKFWNNGQINVRARTCPPGFVPGRLKKRPSVI